MSPTNPEKTLNIREVARLADVSPATVSRVMNGTANVRPDKRQRVLDAIARTAFVPNETARTLFKKSARTIGLIIPSIRNPFFTELAAVIDRVAVENGYRLLTCNVGDDLEREKAAIQMLVATNADGIILASNTEGIAGTIANCRIPIVVVDTWFDAPNVRGFVYSDYRQGGRLAAQHLIACGCRNIVCIQGPQRFYTARERYLGYLEVCRSHGLPEQVVCCDYDFDAGMAMTEELLRTYPDVDGIIACNDIVAISTYKVLHSQRIDVPGTIQLVGYDDVKMARLVTPELTTIAQPIEAIGVRAAALLMGDAPQTPGGKYIFPVSLTPRETTRVG